MSIKLDGDEKKDDFSHVVQPQQPDGPAIASSNRTLTLTSGSHTLIASICGGSSAECAADTVVITYTPPPPPANQAPPSVSFAPHNDVQRDFMSHAATASYAAPGYVSMGQPRALSLYYSSELADPRALVQVDVRDPSLIPAQKFSIKVRLQGTATWLSQSNGYTEAYYANTGGGPDSIFRLAAQVPAGTLPSGAHTLEVEVTSRWPDSTTRSTVQPVNVLVLNRRQSPYGTGWWVQGLQAAYPSAGGVLIDQGDGTASYFRLVGSSYVSPPGDPTTLTWVPGDSLVRKAPDGTRTVFGPVTGAVRQHVYTRTQLGQKVSYTYDSGGRLAGMTDPAGKQTTLTYQTNASGVVLLSAVTSPGGRQMQVVREPLYTDFYDADGMRGMRQTHTSAGRQTALYPRSGGAWVPTYSAFGTLSKLESPVLTVDGVQTRVATRFTTPLEFMLPGSGQGTMSAPLARVRPGTPHTRIVGPRGDTTRVWSDRFGLPTRVVAPLGEVTVIERDGEGRPTMIAVDSDTTRMWYNADGTVRSRYDKASDALVNYAYQSMGGATFLASTTGGGNDVRYARDSLGAVDTIFVKNERVATFTYEADYQIRTARDAQDHTTEYFYAGNPWRNVDSVRVGMPTDRQRTATTYDAYGRTATVTDPLGRTTSFTYDLRDQLLKQRAPGDSVLYAYNERGLTTVTDAAGKQYGFSRNLVGAVVQETDPAGRATAYRYDAAGNVTGTTDRWGRIFRSEYDLLGRRTRFISHEGDTTRYVYHSKRVMSVGNRESEDTFVYDGAGNLASQAAQMGGHTFEMVSGYEPSGVRSSLAFMRGSTWAPAWKDSIAYTHNTKGQLGTIVTNHHDLTTVDYNPDGLPISLGFPGGVATLTIGYTPRHAISSAQYDKPALNTAFGGGTLSQDLLDRITRRTSHDGKREREYAYDARGHLSGYEDRQEVVLPLPPHCQGSATEQECLYPGTGWSTVRLVTYALDAVGNRTGTTTSQSGGGTTSQSDTLQRSSNRYATYGGWTLQYDTVGNLVTRTSGSQQYRYRWNSVGQLTAVITPAGDSVAYGYNGLGMRVRRTQGPTTVRYLYDGDDLAAELDTNGNPIRTYRYWPGIDQPHSMQEWANGQKGQQHFYALDLPSSNVRGLFYAQNPTTTVVSHQYSYGPFGEAQGASGSTGQPLRFAARELDATTGLYYVRARWYDASMGRFMSEDPIGLAGGINNYAYAANDPVNLSDPTGLCNKGGFVIVLGTSDRCRSTRGALSFLMDQWNGIRGGDGAASMAGVSFAVGWQNDGAGKCPSDWTREECDAQTRQAIEELRQHPSRLCRWLGKHSQKLFESNDVVYDPGTTDFGYVYPHRDPRRAAQGASRPPIYLGPSSFEDAGGNVVVSETRNTIAHEAYHLLVPSSGLDAHHGTAYRVGDYCARD